MNITQLILKILLILVSISIGFMVLEIVLFPKQVVEYDQRQFENSQVLDVNYKLRSNKYAVGKRGSDLFGSEAKISPLVERHFSSKDISLQINEREFSLIDDKFIANKLDLLNNTNEEICFPTEDGQIFLIMQAKDIFGNWKDIEYRWYSGDPFSYYSLCLEEGKSWEFASPQFQGRHKTKYRYRLEDAVSSVLSNEVDGFVNTGQFINKLKYHPQNLVDRYYCHRLHYR